MDGKRHKTAKRNEIKHKSPAVLQVNGMKKLTAQIEYWEARLTRMGCSIYSGTHPRWLEYEHELGGFFLAADAEYAYPAKKHRTGAKPQAE
jgi:hypothetical protein